jgi:hypothetical protein
MTALPDLPPFGISQREKENRLACELHKLTLIHYESCEIYRNIIDRNRVVIPGSNSLYDIPFLPVRLFKFLDLLSVDRKQIIKTLLSSGTSNQRPSRIYLDKETSSNQVRTLVKILQSFIGVNRMPMLIIDHPNVIKDRNSFSARGAGILGLSNFGSDHTYVLMDESMECDWKIVTQFITKHSGKRLLLFGFTFMVWQYFVQAALKKGIFIDLSESVLLHSGGWKKLESEAVTNDDFKARLKKCFGISHVHNFYGMAEQVGTVYVECEFGRLHTPVFSDVLIRNPVDWKPMAFGQAGLVQVLSLLPRSYPGHSLLTEDIGEILGIDDCPCGRLGKTIRILGRVAKAEARGCSDTNP